jgi:hypothetical protein
MLKKRDRNITQEAASSQPCGLVRRVDGDLIHLSYIDHQTGAGGKALVGMSARVRASRDSRGAAPISPPD